MNTDGTTATKYILSMPFDATFVPIIPELAMQIGMKESVIIEQLSMWLKHSENIREGKYWVYKCLREWHEAIPYLGEETIRRTILSLKEQGYILIDNFNEKSYDNTQWFALEPDKCSSLLGVYVNAITTPAQNEPQGETTQKEGGAAQNGATIPESLNTEIESTLSGLATPAPVSSAKTEPVQSALPLPPEPNLPKTPYKAIKAAVVEEEAKVEETDKPKKERKPRPVDERRNALAKAFNITPASYAHLGNLARLIFGTSKGKHDAWYECQLETPATLDEVKRFESYAKKRARDHSCNIPTVPATVQRWFEDFRSIGKIDEEVEKIANILRQPHEIVPIGIQRERERQAIQPLGDSAW